MRTKNENRRTKKTGRIIYLFLLPSFLFFLSACGFQPMYGTSLGGDYGSEDLLSYIQIENIPNREGVYLRNALIDRFHRNGKPVNPTYVLNVKNLDGRTIDLDITQEADTTREQLRLSAVITLTDKITGIEVLKRKLTSTASYNVLDSEFSTRISRRNAHENALDTLARQIETQITLYFNREASGL